RSADQLNILVDDIGLSGEIVLPNLIAQPNDIVFARLVFAWKKGTSEQRLYSEHIEEVVGALHCTERHRPAWPFEVDPAEHGIAGKCIKCTLLRTDIEVA